MSDEHEPLYSRIELAKQAFNFSIGHFTILSATTRENLHGHNFQLMCDVTAPLPADGLVFDYGILKGLLKGLCDELDETMVLPEKSPYLKIEKDVGYVVAVFNGERIPFLDRDITILPITNVTVEELSHYFLRELLKHPDLQHRGIVELSVKVSSSPGQSGVATWKKP